MAGKFNAVQHPRDRFGRFTKSRTVKATPKDRAAAKTAAEGFTPKQVGADRKAYLQSIAQDGTAGGLAQVADVNKELRAGKDSPSAAGLERSMVDLPDDVLLSRRVPLSAFGATDPVSLTGMKVRDAGFAPTQLGTVKAADGQVRMRIAAPAGTRAAVNPATGEVILDRDTEMVVARVEKSPAGGHDMYLTVLPKAGTKPQPAGEPQTEPAGTADSAKTVRGDLMKLKVAELQAQMRERGLKPGKLRKSQLVDALVGDETGHEPATPTYDDRVTAAVADRAALTSVPFSLVRPETHARLGNRKGLSVESRDALIAYREHDYARINGQLRDAGQGLDPVNDPEADQWIQQIDTAMTASPLPGDVVTWRGLRTGRGIFGERLEGDLTGMEWREDAYVSSSADRDIAEGFAGSRGVLMRVLTPAGVGAVQVSGMGDDAGHENEAEILIEHGVGVRVVADRGIDANRIRHLDVEVLKGVPGGVDR